MKVDILVRPYDREHHVTRPWQIVKEVFDEYGFPFDENDYDRDLIEPERFYAAPAGGFAVGEIDGEAAGCVGWTDEGGGVVELHRLYVLAGARRHGLGEALVRWVLAEARRSAREVVLFSDVHFTDAHRLYERLGFHRYRFRYAPDPWQSREWGYRLVFDADIE